MCLSYMLGRVPSLYLQQRALYIKSTFVTMLKQERILITLASSTSTST